jgi:hypothetical protein
MRKVGTALGPTINPGLLTVTERPRYGGYRRREEINAAVLALAKDRVPITAIVRRLDHSWQLVRQVIQGERQLISRTRRSSLDLLLPVLRSNVPRLLKLPLGGPVVCLRTPPTGQKSLLEALAEARTLVPVLCPEPTIRRIYEAES